MFTRLARQEKGGERKRGYAYQIEVWIHMPRWNCDSEFAFASTLNFILNSAPISTK
jgi:hypothetical protein